MARDLTFGFSILVTILSVTSIVSIMTLLGFVFDNWVYGIFGIVIGFVVMLLMLWANIQVVRKGR